MEEEQQNQKNYSQMLEQQLIFNSPGPKSESSEKCTGEQENTFHILKFRSPQLDKKYNEIPQHSLFASDGKKKPS